MKTFEANTLDMILLMNWSIMLVICHPIWDVLVLGYDHLNTLDRIDRLFNYYFHLWEDTHDYSKVLCWKRIFNHIETIKTFPLTLEEKPEWMSKDLCLALIECNQAYSTSLAVLDEGPAMACILLADIVDIFLLSLWNLFMISLSSYFQLPIWRVIYILLCLYSVLIVIHVTIYPLSQAFYLLYLNKYLKIEWSTIKSQFFENRFNIWFSKLSETDKEQISRMYELYIFKSTDDFE